MKVVQGEVQEGSVVESASSGKQVTVKEVGELQWKGWVRWRCLLNRCAAFSAECLGYVQSVGSYELSRQNDVLWLL